MVWTPGPKGADGGRDAQLADKARNKSVLRVTEEIVVVTLITLVKSSKPIPMWRRVCPRGNEDEIRPVVVIPLQM